MSQDTLLFLAVVFCTLFTFIALAMAFGSLLGGEKTESKVKSRISKLTAVPEELKAEFAAGLADEKKRSLLSNVDLKPVLGRFTGEAFFNTIEQDLARADIPLRVSEFLILRGAFACIGALGVALISRNLVLGVLAFLVFSFLHVPIIHMRKGMRVNKFTTQLADFLILVVNSLRAGQSFLQGCNVAVAESPEPIASEFRQVIKETNLGMPEQESLENMLLRVPSEELKIVVSGYIIQRKVGGNLAEILEKTAATIRDRLKIQGQINVLTTQGKLSGVLVASMPFVIGGAVAVINPDYIKPLISTVPGYFLIGFALSMQLLGAFIIWRIVDIEI
ncbi:MAG: type II secretion system F family protein [Candidatus Methylacidiphilales bacterium]|nr:type II secretion system F family protein [Candidatus Methylacidiphilales bacterium]